MKQPDNRDFTTKIPENLDPQVEEGLKFFRKEGSLSVGAFQNKFGLNLADAEALIEKVEKALDKESEEEENSSSKGTKDAPKKDAPAKKSLQPVNVVKPEAKEDNIIEKQSSKEEKVILTKENNSEKDNDDKKDTNTDKTKEQINEDAKEQALENFKSQRATIVNIDEIAEAEARKAADAHMTMSKESQKGIKGWLTKLWKHTFFDEYYRQKEMNRVRSEITSTDNIYVGRIKDTDRLAHKNAMHGISERFASEYDGMIREGEERKVLDSKDPATINAITDIKNLIAEYANGNIKSDAAFDISKKRILDTLNDSNNKDADILKGAGHYADNLLEIAKNAKIAIEHGVKMQELDLDTKIIIGKAKSSLKTEAHFNKVDKLIDKMKKSKVGKLISPAVLSTTVGIAYSITVGVGGKLLRSKAAAIGTFGAAVLISSAFAGMDESQRLEEEKAQDAIDDAEGIERPKLVEPTGKSRREQRKFKKSLEKRNNLEKFRYQMESSSGLSGRLRGLMFEKDKNGKDVIKNINNEEANAILASLADIDARHSLNEEKRIDLISYSKIGNVETESTDLYTLTAIAKLELIKKLGKENFNSSLKEQTQIMKDSLLGGEKGIDKKDKQFKKYKRWEVSKKVLKTMTVGLVVGATVQEGLAFFQDDVQGAVEGIFHHDAHILRQTPLDNVFDWATGHPTHMGMGNAMHLNLGGHEWKIPEGTSMIQNGDGTYNLLRGDTVISDHVTINFGTDGYPDHESIELLGKSGIVTTEDCNNIEGTTTVHNEAEDYIKNHPGSTTEIELDGHYDNDTKVFDGNELKLQFGGINGTGINSDGNYVFTVHNMTDAGSVHEQFSVAAQEKINNGELNMAFSLTEDTQKHVFKLPVNLDGDIIIKKDSEIAKLMCGVKDGQLDFHGKFGQIIESFGSKDGVEHVKTLSTIVGPGNNSIEDIVPACIETPVTVADFPVGVNGPMFIPFVVHNPLEPLPVKEDVKKETKDKTGEAKEKTAVKETVVKNKETNPNTKTAEKEADTIMAVPTGTDNTQETAKKKPVVIKENGAEIKKEFKPEDLAQMGTEFENESYFYKTIATSKPLWGLLGKDVTLEITDRETKKTIVDTVKEKVLLKELAEKQIKITKVLEKK